MGARCTINRAVFPLGVGAGVGRGFASLVATANTDSKIATVDILIVIIGVILRWVFQSRNTKPDNETTDDRSTVTTRLRAGFAAAS